MRFAIAAGAAALSLAATALAIVVWTGFWETAGRGLLGAAWGGVPTTAWAVAASPWHAVLASAQPFSQAHVSLGALGHPAAAHALFAIVAGLLLNGIAVWRVRIWNPTRELLPRSPEPTTAQAAPPHTWSLAALRGAGKSTDAPSTAVAGRDWH